MRLTLGYVLRMFPQASETFVANEMLELERMGADIRVFSYRRPRSSVPHACIRRIRAPRTYLPDPLYRHPLALAAAVHEARRLDPDRFRRTARSVLEHTRRERDPDTWRRFLQAASLACALSRAPVAHLHAHFAHGATRVAMLTSMLTGVPFSFTAHARDVFSDDVDFRLFREKLAAARFAVTVSHYNKRFLARRLGAIVEDKVHVVYNGVDLDVFAPGPPDERDEVLVLAVGRLVEKKGFSVLVDACARLRARGRAIRCLIVGEGELRAQLERAAGVSLSGLVSQEELPALYRRAAVLVLPSIPARDGNCDALPTVLLEGMACGTPVVASRLTGIPEIVDHGKTGLLVEPGNPEELAAALDLLLGDRELRERFGVAGRDKAERCFDLKENVRLLHDLFAETHHEVRVPVL